MPLDLQIVGKGLEDFRRGFIRLEKERRRDIGKVFKSSFKRAVKSGRSLVSRLFGGRGKRIKRAFVSNVRVRSDDVVGRLGYVKPKGKGGSRRFWWLGRIYEMHSTIRNRTKKNAGRSLWVPIGTNRGGGGSPVMPAREFFSSMRGRSVIKATSRGNRVAFSRDDSGELVPMFVLKQSVAIRPRRAVTPTARKFKPQIQKEVGSTLFQYFK